MSFGALIEKVSEAEVMLEAQERRMAADWRQFKHSWRMGWTPARILIAGVSSGYLMGKAGVAGKTGTGTLQLLTALSGLFAGGSAQAAAGEAEAAANSVQQATGNMPPASIDTGALTTQPLDAL